ncbi:hypothetical protein E2C01_033295 [Portunus trituberculatus]|uniref:Uncharacterized protein n=1 Tax=Portunus trituberculatus TaxID=210409 RepID=A0A5B7F2L1_PORTR|nr:hypothetical protein [Portunus trituberculatus]
MEFPVPPSVTSTCAPEQYRAGGQTEEQSSPPASHGPDEKMHFLYQIKSLVFHRLFFSPSLRLLVRAEKQRELYGKESEKGREEEQKIKGMKEKRGPRATSASTPA